MLSRGKAMNHLEGLTFLLPFSIILMLPLKCKGTFCECLAEQFSYESVFQC